MRPCASGRASSARPSPTRSGVGCHALATSGTSTVCHEHISRAKEVWRCTIDEGRPLEVGSQVPASNPCKLRSSRAIVVSVAVKGGRQSRQVRSGEASESEPLMTCRNAKDDVKTGGASSFRDQFGGCPEDCPSDIRHVGGAKPDQALSFECCWGAEGGYSCSLLLAFRADAHGTCVAGSQPPSTPMSLRDLTDLARRLLASPVALPFEHQRNPVNRRGTRLDQPLNGPVMRLAADVA